MVEELAVETVDGSAVNGFLGFVPGSSPSRLVVFCHGRGQTIEHAWRDHVARTVRPDVAVVTTNYRDNLRFPALAGAEDTIAATLLALERFPSVTDVFLLGVSMGGNISGNAIVESKRFTADGKSLYDWWVDVEGVSNLTETWLEAKLVGDRAAGDIEHDAGGSPFTAPAEFTRRSPVLHAADMKALGLRGAVVVHGTNDGTVPTNHGVEMATALALAAIPTREIFVFRGDAGTDHGTTLTGVLSGFAGLDDPNEFLSLSGHGDEADATHPVIRTGFRELESMLDGEFDESVPFATDAVDD